MRKHFFKFFIRHGFKFIMSKYDIAFLVFKYTRLFCDRHCCIFGISGDHNYLYTCIIKYFNGFDSIGSNVISQTKNCHKYGLAVNYFYYRKKFHSSFCLCKYLLFNFLSVIRCEFLKFSVLKYVMCYLVDNIFSCTLPIYQSVFKLYGSTLFLGVESAYIFDLIRIVIGITVSVMHSIGK